MNRLTLSNGQSPQAIDDALVTAHRLFQNEVARQRELYKAHMGRYPYYHYEHDHVATRAKEALSAAHRALLGG